MIIEKVQNLNKKSWNGYTNPEDLIFKQRNIIFGYNGSGKSSLADGIVDEFRRNNVVRDDNFRYFNKDYLGKILLSENKNLRGVKASFGKKNVDIENEINENKKRLDKTNYQIEGLEEKLKKIENDINTRIKEIFMEKKGNINLKQKSGSFKEKIELYKKDYNSVKESLSDVELKKASSDTDYEKLLNQIESLDIGTLESFNLSKSEEIKNICEFIDYSLENVPEQDLLLWLNKGLQFHTNTKNCEFCDGKLYIEKIRFKIKKYNENKKAKDEATIREFYNNLSTFCKSVYEIYNKKDLVKSFIDIDEQFYLDLENYSKEILGVQQILKDKLEKMEKLINFDILHFSKSVSCIVEIYEMIKLGKEKLIDVYKERFININQIIRGAIGYGVINDSFIIKNTNDYNNIENDQIKLEKERKSVLQNIKTLVDEKSSVKDFCDFLNDVLHGLNSNLKLKIQGNDYVIKTRDDTNLAIKDISEGEKNMLMLLFFYFELFNDNKQKDFKKEIKLIIIDDPISSLDNHNSFYVLDLIRKILNLKENFQLFIFTHSWDNFCNLTFGKKGAENNFRFFEVYKNFDGESQLKTQKCLTKPYKYNFIKLLEFSEKKDASQFTDCEIYHYPNLLRIVLEEYISFILQDESVQPNSNVSNKNKIIKVLYNEEPDKVGDDERIRLESFLSVCNILSHEFSRSPDDILNAAKFFLERIKKTNKQHYDSIDGSRWQTKEQI
ncbi:MAG: AAA family ATPase [Bifidobacteriaceae bacterium]|jgi:DNA repair exonuclease SbcCD ATPase subunit|nr:AAA family ATPase [Bifidobacteriaceae bacterium]